MSLSPAAMALIIQGIQAGVTALEAGEKGEKDEETIMSEYDTMQDGIREASSQWRNRDKEGGA